MPAQAERQDTELLNALLALLPGHWALCHRGELVAASGSLASAIESDDPCASIESLVLALVAGTDESKLEVEEFLAEPAEGELIVGGEGAPMIELSWRELKPGWWLFSAAPAMPEDPGAQRRRSLLAQVTHDLKTPLITMRGYAELMMARTPLDEQQRHYMHNILQEVHRQESMIEDLLHASQAAAGRLPIRPEATDLAAVLREAADDFGARFPERTLLLDIPESLPVHADAPHILEVLDNLLNNAHAYSAPGEPISLKAEARPAEVWVVVTDRGAGIAREEIERLFEPFYRGQDSPPGGAGLGLAISEAIVRAHHGRIWAESKEGHGSAFSFTLPIRNERS